MKEAPVDIWVGVDGSLNADNALIWATHVPRTATGHRIRPVMTWHIPAIATISPTGLPASYAMSEATQTVADAVVQRTQHDVDSAADVRPAEVHAGEPSHCLLELAQPGDMIVVGSRGLGGFSSLVLGSVSSRLAAASSVPVCIIPATGQPASSSPENVIVGVDGSAAATNAALWAAGTFPNANIQLTKSWLEPALAGIDFLAYNSQAIEHDVNAALDETADAIRRAVPNPDRVTAKLLRDDAREVLLTESRSNDLLVLGRQVGHALWRALGGSVAHSVVHHLDTPTVIVPS